MFKVNPDGMRMEPTPERVLSVCRLIAHKSMTRDEIRKAMTLDINDEKELDQINKSVNVALEELSIIKSQADNLVSGCNCFACNLSPVCKLPCFCCQGYNLSHVYQMADFSK